MTQVKEIKIIFWGTPEFALPSLEALIEAGCNIVAVVTNPDEPVGRKQILTPPPVKVFAEKHKPRTFSEPVDSRAKRSSEKVRGKIPVFQPETLKSNPFFAKEFSELQPDLCIVAAYGKIILREILEIPKLGFLNIHPSLLPRWRGPSPIQYTILKGDTETGVTIIKVDEQMDHGPIVAWRQLENYKLQITNYKTLHDELAKLGAELLIETLPKWIRREITPVPQNDSQATYSKILKKDDGRINWSRPAEEIERMVRAFNPWPGTWTIWPSGEKICRIKIEEADTVRDDIPAGSPGYISGEQKDVILVKCGKGGLLVKKLKLEGKKSIETQAFLLGHPDLLGATFI